jgi:hypothetical protein
MYVEYPDIPQVPSNLLIERIEWVEQLVSPYTPEQIRLHGDVYMAWLNASRELEEFLQPYFTFPVTHNIAYHRIGKNIPIHVDNFRKECYNYIIDCGGDNVYTNFYDEDKVTLLHQEVIPARTWHKLNVSVNHNVTGIEPGRSRFALTIAVI